MTLHPCSDPVGKCSYTVNGVLRWTQSDYLRQHEGYWLKPD
jgi:hypothetical protein